MENISQRVKNLRLVQSTLLIVSTSMITLLYLAGCMTTDTTRNTVNKYKYRKIGKATKKEYKVGDKFSSGTIEWLKVRENKIASFDRKFVLVGSKERSKMSKQFFHAIPLALEFIKEISPHYYDMMKEVNSNIIRFGPMLEEKSVALGGYQRGGYFGRGETIIGKLEIGSSSRLYILSLILVHEIAIHANEQVVRKKDIMNRMIQNVRPSCIHLNFLMISE